MNLIVKDFESLTKKELYEILKARTEVFIVEQKMNCQDMDDVDYECLHFWYEADGKVIAYLRAFYADEAKTTAKIGRVLTLTHGVGHGRMLMEESLAEIKSRMGISKVYLHSQKHAAGFYEKLGFVTVSGEYLEEGVVHVSMEKEI